MWEKETAVAHHAARTSGKILSRMYGQVNHVTKKGEIDLVTEADLQAEKAILEILERHFPHDHILSEEAGSAGQSSTRTWFVDPLDGTTNFAHGFPVFAVSIALHDITGPLVGVIYDPLRNECFAAARGQGATLNGNPVQSTSVPRLKQALLATGFPYDRHTAEDNNIDSFKAFIRKAQGVRRAGAAALDLAYVACGRLDGFWEVEINQWDVAAGGLIAREAGAKITDVYGDPDFLRKPVTMVGANPTIHKQMLDVLAKVRSEYSD